MRKLQNNDLDLYTPQSDLHTDAAFSDAEEFGFMAGEKINVRSSWQVAAQWDSDRQVLTIWTALKSYDFPGMGEVEARLYAQSDSKGSWYWAIWKGRSARGQFPKHTAGFGKPGVRTPVAKKIVRKPAAASRRSWWG